MRLIGLQQPLLGLQPGKWDRFATFGEKEQGGERFVFTVATFGQMVDNFATQFRGRRLGLDYEHQALNAVSNGQAAPNLAYYNALAVIEAGQVVRFYAQDTAVMEPDPAALLTALRAKFPEDPDADGLWGFRCEHTPLGAQLLPNYEQLSPLFTAEGEDEQGNPVGYRLLNVSAVNVAFQDRTVLMLSANKRAAPPAARGATMTDENKDKEEQAGGATRAQACKALGLPEDASDEAMMGAICAKMGDLVIEHKDEEEEKAKGDEPALSALSAIMEKRLKGEQAAREAAEKRVAALETAERQRELTAFYALCDARMDRKEADELLKDAGGKIALASKLAQRVPVKAGERQTLDGAPRGAVVKHPGTGALSYVGRHRVIGASLQQAARKLMDEGKAKTVGEAQILAAKANPGLYAMEG